MISTSGRTRSVRRRPRAATSFRLTCSRHVTHHRGGGEGPAAEDGRRGRDAPDRRARSGSRSSTSWPPSSPAAASSTPSPATAGSGSRRSRAARRRWCSWTRPRRRSRRRRRTRGRWRRAGGEVQVFRQDARTAIGALGDQGMQFDVVYLDPPYASDLYEPLLALVGEGPLLAEGGVVVAEHFHKRALPETIGALTRTRDEARRRPLPELLPRARVERSGRGRRRAHEAAAGRAAVGGGRVKGSVLRARSPSSRARSTRSRTATSTSWTAASPSSTACAWRS